MDRTFILICLSAFLLVASFSTAVSAQAAYLEADGLVVIELENAADLNGWETANTISSATGTGYINWTGNQFLSQTGNGALSYLVNITTTGTYRFEWRVAVGFGDDSTEHNDSWLKIGGDNYYAEKAASVLKPKPACQSDPAYDCPEGSTTNGFFKIYGGGVNAFQWAARTSDNDAHQIYATFDAPGIYEIEVNARSSFHAIDRLVMYHSSVTTNAARSLANPESALDNSGVADVSGELRTWHDVQLTFDGPATSETATPNPFSDYRLDVTFTNGTTTYVVPGYYAADGNAAETSARAGNKWRVHFAPDMPGAWNWTVAFKTGTDIAVTDNNTGGTSAGFMDGETGTLLIAATDKTGRDHRGKGRLEYVNEHYLRYAGTGEWFVKAGADAPENTLAYEDFDEVPNAAGRRKSWQPHQQDYVAAEAAAYTWQNGKGTELLGVVNYLSTKGVNAFSFLTFNTAGDDKNVFPHLLIDNLPDNTSVIDWNELHHDRFDVSRTAQWERIFSYADVKGMYMHFKTQETENETLMDGGNVARERKLYYRELIARFSHHLALNWNMGEESRDQTDQQRKDMAAYFAATDPYNHLRVIHTYPGEKNAVYTPLLGAASDYTGLSLQTGNGNQLQTFTDTKTWVTNSATAGKKWVVAVDEPGNATIGVDSDPRARKLTRHRVVWGNFMAGGGGTEFYYGYQSGCGDLECQDHRTREEKYTDAAFALTYFQTYFQPYFPNVTNADELASANGVWVLNANDQAFTAYLPDGGSTNITLPDNGTTWQVRWYNPRDGSIGSATAITNSLTAPDTEDWVALIEAGNCTAGAACNDGDDCTTGEILDDDCNCTGGTLADADNDSVCDADDQCPGFDDLADVDNDNTPDGCDDCDNRTTGTACDDGDPDTTNDVINANCNCVGAPIPGRNDYYYEAECATRGGGWLEVADTDAAGGIYLTPSGDETYLDAAPTAATLHVVFTLDVQTAGAYKVFARVRTTSDSDDSFWVRANDTGDWVQWNKIGYNYGYDGYIWARAGEWTTGNSTTPVTFALMAGENTITFAAREPNIQFDQVFVTLDGDAPTGPGPTEEDCGDAEPSASCGDGTPFTILHYTETEGFDHNTRNNSRQMFEAIGTERGFTVVNSEDQSAFDDLTNYEVIVFSNTTGDIPFTSTQKANFETYIANGGAVLGIHGATDMYREGVPYPFYTNLMGGSRRNDFPHTSANFNGTMNKIGTHVSTDDLPDPWNKQEEYYYWPDTGLVDNIIVVLEVEATGTNTYDNARPMSWYQTFDSGARSFYTALGHANGNYTNAGNDFRKHVADALCWLVDAGGGSLPVGLISAGLTQTNGVNTIDWRVGEEIPLRVELYGGFDQASATLLSTDAAPDDYAGELSHLAPKSDDVYFYRLRFTDEAGLTEWSEWLVAFPSGDQVGGGAQVQYADEGAVLVVPAGGPTQAIVTDASGRTIGGLQLTEGRNLLPAGPAGIYFIRFPFRTETLKYVVRR